MTRHRNSGKPRQDLLSAATAHARRGWHVFPLRPGAKQPALHGQDHCPRTGPCRDAHQGWEQRATTDLGRIQACWRHGPYNIGIACGPSGLVVIDLDTPRDGTPPPAEQAVRNIYDGASALGELCRLHCQPRPTATFTVATPCGIHLYFTTPADPRLRNSVGRLGWRIDTRAAGGYVVGAGSVLGGTGYTIVNPAIPQPLPAWLIRLLADPATPPDGGEARPRPPFADAHSARYARAVLEGETSRVLAARQGQRNDTLNRAAFALGQLAAAGLIPALLAQAALTDVARRIGLDRDPNCGPRGVDRTIRSGLAAGARKPRWCPA